VTNRLPELAPPTIAAIATPPGRGGIGIVRVSGANLDRVIEGIRERAGLRRLVRSLTAQGRMSRWVVTFLPVGLLLVISVVNPTYMKPLFTHTSGRVVLAIGAFMIVCGSLVIKKIVNIKI